MNTMNPISDRSMVAYHLRMLIEQGAPDDAVLSNAHDLARRLGGVADARAMTPAGAALYLIALLLSQPPE